MDEANNQNTDKADEIYFAELLSKEDFLKLAQSIKRDGVIDEAELERLFNWAGKALSDAMLVNLMMEGFLKVERWENDVPLFFPTTTDGFDLTGTVEETEI